MKSLNNTGNFRLFGDGRDLVLGAEGSIYHFKGALIKNFTVEMMNDLINLGFGIPTVSGLKWWECGINLIGEELIFSNDLQGILNDLDFFRNSTIRDLFKVINKKLEERNERI